MKLSNNTKIILASGLFIILTALKLLVPEQTATLRETVRETVSRDRDYVQSFEQLGERLASSAFVRALLGTPQTEPEEAAAETDRKAFEPKTIDELRAIMLKPLPDSLVPGAALESAAPNVQDQIGEALQELEDGPSAVMAAFLEAQAQYADYELPANVIYECPALPFSFASPVSGYTSSGFGYRLHPLTDEVKYHYGTDFAAWSGTGILSFADGTVTVSGWDDGFGNYIVIDHGGGWQTLYAHCSTVYVGYGQQVKQGESIALVGDTGQVTGPHLHFELTCNGVYYNPEFYFA